MEDRGYARKLQKDTSSAIQWKSEDRFWTFWIRRKSTRPIYHLDMAAIQSYVGLLLNLNTMSSGAPGAMCNAIELQTINKTKQLQ